jgi:uncharacterized protein
MTNLTDPFSSFSGLLRSALGDALLPSAGSFLDMVAANIVMEFPYAPPGALTEVIGKSALAEYLPGVASLIDIDQMALTEVYRASQPGVFILEFTCSGKGVQTGIAYDQSYISVVTIRDGLIARYRDYWNPLIALKAMGGDEAIATALKGTAGEA